MFYLWHFDKILNRHTRLILGLNPTHPTVKMLKRIRIKLDDDKLLSVMLRWYGTDRETRR